MVEEECYQNSWDLNKETHSWEGASVGTWLGTSFSLRIWVPKMELKNWFCWLWCQRTMSWGKCHLECFGRTERSFFLLEILQNSEQLELLPSLSGTTEFEVLARALKVFSVVLARSSSGISGVTELLLEVQSPVVFLPLCGCILCPFAHPLLRRASRKRQFSHLWWECSNPEVFSRIF